MAFPISLSELSDVNLRLISDDKHTGFFTTVGGHISVLSQTFPEF